MNFMAQFHKQLVSQLPPAVVEEVKNATPPRRPPMSPKPKPVETVDKPVNKYT
jgi:hypothetical protein